MSNDARPEIRFPGFTDDWEQRKLGDETKILAGGDVDKTKLKENGKYPVLANALTNDGIVGYYDDDFRIKAPAVTVTGRGDVGYAQARRVNFTPVVRLLSVKSKHDVDFLENSINNHKVLVESTGIPQLTAPQLGNYKIFFPTIEEETKIGSLFKKLDTAINIHQRELDLLKQTKKGFLQKMFPKNGAKVPEIRFPVFKEEWEECEVLNLSSDIYGGGTPKTNSSEYWNGEIPWIQSSDLSMDRLFNVAPKKYITENAVENSATKIVPANSIAIVTRVGVGKLAFMPYEFTTSQDFLSLANLKIDSYFGVYSFYQMLQNELNKTQGTSIKGITKSDLLGKRVTIPIDFEEQQKIGAFFKQLDDTITLHQRELDVLKETKKGFLQKMFV
ncbi:restriction endonuclease subunit S [Enterococcus sp. AZ084]|uniref:restriction endonuclease subunit S n=1 Tax=Enterococcus sp. AZ084 TaxID=2774671 RepID=UPI003F20C469